MDDGSIDNTKMTVESFRDPRIIYNWTENSGGPATPRNRGIDSAKADWICFLDADDLWYPNKLKEVAEVIENNPKLDFICHNEVMYVSAANNKTLLKYGPYESDFYRVMLMEGNRASTSATSVRREFLNEHGLRFNQSPDYVIVEDYDMWLRIAFKGGKFYFINNVLGEYIIENDNISSNLLKMHHNYSTLLHDHVYQLQTFQLDKDFLWRKLKVKLLINDAKNLFSKKQYTSGLRYLTLAFHISFAESLRYIFLKIRKAF